MPGRLALLLVLLTSTCRSVLPSEDAAAPVSAPPPAATPPPAPVPPPELRVVSCGFGGVGPAALPPAPDAWIVALVAVSAPSAPRTGLRAGEVTLIDARGAVVARTRGPVDVLVAPPGRTDHDFSADGTSAFAGDLAKGASVQLRLNAALGARLAALYKAWPLRARVTLVDANGARTTAESADCSSWPTG